MLRKLFAILGFICLIVTLPGCSADPNNKANELFIKAEQNAQRMKADSESYSIALESYKTTENHIDRILSKYPDSNIATSLVSGETQISGLTLSRFRNLESNLQLLADAEREPLSFAVLADQLIADESYKARSLREIAVKFAEIGEKPSRRDMTILSEMVHSLYPIELFWE